MNLSLSGFSPLFFVDRDSRFSHNQRIRIRRHMSGFAVKDTDLNPLDSTTHRESDYKHTFFTCTLPLRHPVHRCGTKRWKETGSENLSNGRKAVRRNTLSLGWRCRYAGRSVAIYCSASHAPERHSPCARLIVAQPPSGSSASSVVSRAALARLAFRREYFCSGCVKVKFGLACICWVSTKYIG